NVEFFTLSNEIFPALLRRLTVKNISKNNLKIECLDGLPIILPYGTNDWNLKNMSRLAEGWYNGVFYSNLKKVPVYKLPVEPVDRPEIIPIHSANFYMGFYEKDAKKVMPKYFIDPENIFGEVKNFAYPDIFLNSSANNFKVNPNLTGKNKTPSGMGYMTFDLKADEKFNYSSEIGHATDADNIDKFANILLQKNYFEKKDQENSKLISKMTSDFFTKSSLQNFDNYCEQTFIDNFLRGGYPLTLGVGVDKKVYYTYSRVHGDMEREYNNFVVLSEYFSQGNGNYRDVNQNRRSDIFFNQDVKDDIILFFLNLIQSDGFNPLKVLGVKFSITNREAFINDFKKAAKNIDEKLIESLKKYIKKPTTIGSLFNFIEENNFEIDDKNIILNSLIKNSVKVSLANHAEGYWTDHWHYNTDLIENFLAIYPDKLDAMLFENNEYTFYDDCYLVEPRSNKYVLFRGEPKQLNAVYKDEEKENLIKSRANNNPNVVRTNFGKGDIYKTNLLNKLLSLIANKYSSLDPEGIGIEMETDKPNWCDALNGLPGIFGSSTAESIELLRLLQLLKKMLLETTYKENVKVKITEETFDFLKNLETITMKNLRDFDFWEETHIEKENYRQKTKFGLSGNNVETTIKELKIILDLLIEKVNKGISKKKIFNKENILSTYFEYIPTKYELIKGKFNKKGYQCIKISEFKIKALPLFLEGPVHYLRLQHDKKDLKTFHKNIMKSGLYDKDLGMIKINESIKGVDMNIGRITVFTPGWLEDESIWLHMEYKYMLELLKNELSQEFFDLSKTALIPFMDPNKYGRSIFENSSFIVSSAHPETQIHGQGFVSRLSGATAEFISIWLAMTCGTKPFFIKDGKLSLELKPQLSAELFTTNTNEIEFVPKCYEKNCECKNAKTNKIQTVQINKNSFAFKFLGKILVVYYNKNRKNTFGDGNTAAKIKNYEIIYNNGEIKKVAGAVIIGDIVNDIRDGKVAIMNVVLN
ncbi:MAG: hypothetical protein LBF97_00715, partial [Elusimicrobiota bacterium]|nr:hypothetical protein [Elusimicrobiota bacterium]